MSKRANAQAFQRAAVLTRVLVAWLFTAGYALAEFDFRSIFIDRFDFPYSTGNIPQMTADINAMMQNAADQGLNHVVWQVRGRADALYNSNFEPKTTNLTPGFDPLQVVPHDRDGIAADFSQEAAQEGDVAPPEDDLKRG